MKKTIFLILSVVSLLAGCAVNPVTGTRELALVSESQELNLGREQFEPGRQMQGGDYILEPGLTRYVNQVGQRLAAVSDRELPYEFMVLNNSTPNAWTLPGGKIAVNRGLLVELQNEAELAAVLGHEIVHAAARHGAKNMERGLFLQGALLAAGIAARESDYSRYVVGGAEMAAVLISGKYSRDAEREADYYGMLYMARAGYDPEAAVGLQETFVRLQEGGSANWLSGLFASHPPSQERVAANRKALQSFPPGGRLGIESYRREVAYLLKTKEGYDALVEGRKALAEDDAARAMSFAEKALAVEPREGHFHALQGDVYIARKMYNQAMDSFDRAIDRNSGYFYYYLRRGLTKQELGEYMSANVDLRKSTDLLPTATAYNAMGELALAGGNTRAAMEHFSKAAASDSDSGRAARFSLIQLDLPQNPDRYLRSEVQLGGDFALVRVYNPTPVSIQSVGFVIEYIDKQGNLRRTDPYLLGGVPAGGTISTRVWMGPFDGADATKAAGIRFMQAVVNDARN